jgi:hypothetical protein
MGDVILELLEFIKKEHQQIRENYIEVTKEAMVEMKQLREALEKVVRALENLDKTHIAAAQKQKNSVTLKELARIYPIPLNKLKELASLDEFPAIKKGRRVKVNLDEFEQWFKVHQAEFTESNVVKLHDNK